MDVFAPLAVLCCPWYCLCRRIWGRKRPLVHVAAWLLVSGRCTRAFAHCCIRPRLLLVLFLSFSFFFIFIFIFQFFFNFYLLKECKIIRCQRALCAAPRILRQRPPLRKHCIAMQPASALLFYLIAWHSIFLCCFGTFPLRSFSLTTHLVLYFPFFFPLATYCWRCASAMSVPPPMNDATSSLIAYLHSPLLSTRCCLCIFFSNFLFLFFFLFLWCPGAFLLKSTEFSFSRRRPRFSSLVLCPVFNTTSYSLSYQCTEWILRFSRPEGKRDAKMWI